MTEPEPRTRQCPFCKEEVKVDAIRCKHCLATIPVVKPDHQGICPFCKEEINPEAIRCKHCKTNLVPANLRAIYPEDIPQLLFPRFRTTASAALRLRRVPGYPVFSPEIMEGATIQRSDDAGAGDAGNCHGCPPAIMDESEMWCLIRCDNTYCYYQQCGYV
jgi:hypothetical protein